MEATTLAHVLHTCWCVARRHTNACAVRLLTAALVQAVAADISRDVTLRPLTDLILIRQVIVLHHWGGHHHV